LGVLCRYFWRFVDFAVEFDDQFVLSTAEVGDVITDLVLTTKLQPATLPVP
jgi:hypothetical protein